MGSAQIEVLVSNASSAEQSSSTVRRRVTNGTLIFAASSSTTPRLTPTRMLSCGGETNPSPSRKIDDVRSGGFGDEAVLIQQDRAGSGLPGRGFAIGQIKMHAAAALELGRQTIGRHLSDLAHDHRHAGFVF